MALHLLASEIPDNIIPIFAITFGCTIAIVTIIVSAWKSNVATREREQSRREIAAYVAEGSMTPEQGEKLIAAGTPPPDKDDE